MGVKLLQKSQLAALKAKETAREINEGVKIATRVDGLRELWSKTEQDFEVYKTSTLTAIQKEIAEAQEEKDKITSDLRTLKLEYDLLLPEIPLKRQELSKFEKKLFAWERKLEKRQERVDLAEIDIAETLKKAETARILNEDNERISSNHLRQATKERNEANQTLQAAKKVQEQVYQEKKDTEFLLELRENNIKTKERELSSRELSITRQEKAFEIEKRQLADQRETLQRSIERIREGRLA